MIFDNCGISFIYSKKRSGPKTLPWGTEQQLKLELDKYPQLTFAGSCLLDRNETIQEDLLYICTPSVAFLGSKRRWLHQQRKQRAWSGKFFQGLQLQIPLDIPRCSLAPSVEIMLHGAWQRHCYVITNKITTYSIHRYVQCPYPIVGSSWFYQCLYSKILPN